MNANERTTIAARGMNRSEQTKSSVDVPQLPDCLGHVWVIVLTVRLV
jgi:hypothetical protein